MSFYHCCIHSDIPRKTITARCWGGTWWIVRVMWPWPAACPWEIVFFSFFFLSFFFKKGDIWSKHKYKCLQLFQLRFNWFSLLTQWTTDVRKTGDAERVCMRDVRLSGENERKEERAKMNLYFPPASQPPHTITHIVGFGENICCQQPVSLY